MAARPHVLRSVCKRLASLGNPRAAAVAGARGAATERVQRQGEARELLRWLEAKDRDPCLPRGVYPERGTLGPTVSATALAILLHDLHLADFATPLIAHLLWECAAAERLQAYILRCMGYARTVDPRLAVAAYHRLVTGGEGTPPDARHRLLDVQVRGGSGSAPAVAVAVSARELGIVVPRWVYLHALDAASLAQNSLDSIAAHLAAAAEAYLQSTSDNAVEWVYMFWDAPLLSAACRHIANRVERGEVFGVDGVADLLRFMAAYPDALGTRGRRVYSGEQDCEVLYARAAGDGVGWVLHLRMEGTYGGVGGAAIEGWVPEAPATPDALHPTRRASVVYAERPLRPLLRLLDNGVLLEQAVVGVVRGDYDTLGIGPSVGMRRRAGDVLASLAALGHYPGDPRPLRVLESIHYKTCDFDHAHAADAVVSAYLVACADRGLLPTRLGVWWTMHLLLTLDDPSPAPAASTAMHTLLSTLTTPLEYEVSASARVGRRKRVKEHSDDEWDD